VLAFNLDFYTDVMDLSRLTNRLDDNNNNDDDDDDERMNDNSAFMTKHKKLNEALCGIVDEFSLVGFETLDITDKASVLALLARCDKAIGFFAVGARARRGASDDNAGYDAYSIAVADPTFEYERSLGVQERVFAQALQDEQVDDTDDDDRK
jgi:hypothetical protein